nr:hypothetical protein BaRGS_014193 [Batillaria attramentaria]
MVYHTTLRHWSPTKGVKLIEEVTKKCLTKANKKQYTSIAFPALGTGLLAYPCDVVAETIFRVVKQFGRDVPSTTVREVRIVIYYTDMQIFQTTPVTQFTSVTQFTPVPGEIQLFLYTENKNRTSCAQDFVEKLDKAAIKLMVSEERSYDYETLTALSRDEEQEIIKIGEQHDVKIHLKTRLGRLAATGLKMDVTQVFADKRLSDVFDVVAKRLHEQQLSKELGKDNTWWL